MKFLARCVFTILVCFLGWQGSELSARVANLPYDVAILGSGLIIFVTMVWFFGCLYFLWRKQFTNLKEKFSAWIQDTQD